MSDQFCSICPSADDKGIATISCKTCDPQLQLCEDCASQHLKHLRGHQIYKIVPVGKTESFPFRDDMLDYAEIDHLCFLCLRINKRSAATSVCNDCENLKAMCNECAYQHTRQKMTRDHTIRSGITALNNISCNESNTRRELDEDSQEIDADADALPEVSIPGEPSAINCEAYAIELKWSDRGEQFDYFRIRYREVEDEENEWKEMNTDTENCFFTISNLKPDTKYVFQVKGIFEGRGGEYSSFSEYILTNPSLAQKMCAHCIKDTGEDPKIFEIPSKSIPGTENKHFKVKKILLGGHLQTKSTTYERTILMLGKSGSGKSTMIDAFINYILGVNFDDKFRFTVSTKKEDTRDKWLTVYTLQPFDGSKINFKLNLIDSPGFKKDIHENESILKQLSFLFSADEKSNTEYLDCVCIIVKNKELLDAPKLERSFQNMLSHIGRDLETNICILTTFSSAKTIPALKVVSDRQFPLVGSFDNSVLFANNSQEHSKNEGLSQWDMGWNSFKTFFNHFQSLTRKSIDMTRNLLSERDQIELHVCDMKKDIASIFKDIEQRDDKDKILNKQKEFLELCKDFEYEKKESKVERCEIAKGHHSVYCPICQNTCNEDCGCSESSSTAKCPIIGSSNKCTVCVDNCPLASHARLDFNLKHGEETVKKINLKLKEAFDKLSIMKTDTEKEIMKLSGDINGKHDELVALMEKIAKLKNKLENNSIYPYPKSVDWPIAQIIESEENLKLEGFQDRIEAAKELQVKLQNLCSLKHMLK